MAYCGPRGIALSTFLQWSQSDQDAALAWTGYEGRRCGSCGLHPDEGTRHAHVDICPGCVERDRASKTEEAQARGAHVHLAHGSSAECGRCRTEADANASRPGKKAPTPRKRRTPRR